MSLKALPIPPIPEETARVAHAAFPRSNVFMQVRDTLGTVYTDEVFADLFPTHGQPALAPWRLALVTVFQFMENLTDRHLRQRHPRGTQLPLSTVISYVRQVAEALHYAHQERVIHRDLKPENMLLGRRDEVLLSDFGIAAVIHSSLSQQAQDTAGTIAYMAPEQIQAHPSPASDQYALAVVVYEWLSGDRPFQGTATEIAIKHTLAPPPLLTEKVSTLPLGVEQVVVRALAKDPELRFASVQSFAAALEETGRATSFGHTYFVSSSKSPGALKTVPGRFSSTGCNNYRTKERFRRTYHTVVYQ
jgi:serine/threonine protein kinase